MASKTKKKKSKSRNSAINRAFEDAIFDVSRQMRASFSSRLKELDLYAGQERIILLLAKNDGMTPSDIAQNLGVSAPTIAKSINRLSAGGFLSRKPDSEDRRKAYIHLTELGLSLVSTIRKEQKSWLRQLLKGLTKTDKKNLVADLQFIQNNSEKID